MKAYKANNDNMKIKSQPAELQPSRQSNRTNSLNQNMVKSEIYKSPNINQKENNNNISNKQQQQQTGKDKDKKIFNKVGSMFSRGPYKYIVEGCNNPQVVQKMLQLREWWVESDDQKYFNFKWKPTSYGINFSQFQQKYRRRQLVNHVPGHQELTIKSRLFYNVQRISNQKGIQVDKLIPQTFVFNINTNTYEKEIDQFLSYFQHQNQNKLSKNVYIFKPSDWNCGRGIDIFNELHELCDLLKGYGREDILQKKFHKKMAILSNNESQENSQDDLVQQQQNLNNSIQEDNLQIEQEQQNQEFLGDEDDQDNEQENIININNNDQQNNIENPESSNNLRMEMSNKNLHSHKSLEKIQGNSQIHKLSSLRYSVEQLRPSLMAEQANKNEEQINNNNVNINEKQQQQQQQNLNNNPLQVQQIYGKQTQKKSAGMFKVQQVVVQKYIEDPYLINNRKFDIRIWVCIDQHLNYHIYKEGYIRLSGEKYSLDQNHLKNKFIHLTNNAIQKFGDNYGKEESGNIISYQQLQDIITKNKESFTFETVIGKIKEIIMLTMVSAKKQLSRNETNQSCFELFGYDFMIDKKGQPLLIEVNTNPSIEQSCPFLDELIQRMMNDLFRLTVDRTFLPIRQANQNNSNNYQDIYHNINSNQNAKNQNQQQQQSNSNNSTNNSSQQGNNENKFDSLIFGQSMVGINQFPLMEYKNEEILWERLGCLVQQKCKVHRFKYFDICEYI